MNFKWLLFNLPLQNVWYFAENAEGEQSLSLWKVRASAWSGTRYITRHMQKISAIQQVIRNPKKTRGKWEYLRGKVTLGPPSVRAYAWCALVCIENRPECGCIVILWLLHSVFHSFHFHTCSLVSSDTSDYIKGFRFEPWMKILLCSNQLSGIRKKISLIQRHCNTFYCSYFDSYFSTDRKKRCNYYNLDF